MGKGKKENDKQEGIVIFVEGATDEEFFKKMVSFLKKKNPNRKSIDVIKYHNLKGVSHYKRAHSILKKKILRDNPNVNFKVICSYDTDVFEFQAKPPVNFNEVENNLKEEGAIEVFHIKARKCIEDWFLYDINGLCKYLKASKNPKKLKGKNGLEKIKGLFKSKNKVYQKGHYVHKFMDDLDFNILYSKLENELESLVRLMFK